jgi:hypothetical protein
MAKQIDFSDQFTPEAYQDKDFLKKGTTLGFNKDGELQHYKIVRLNRSKKTCIVTPVKLYTEDEINEMSRKDAERIIEDGAKANQE